MGINEQLVVMQDATKVVTSSATSIGPGILKTNKMKQGKLSTEMNSHKKPIQDE